MKAGLAMAALVALAGCTTAGQGAYEAGPDRTQVVPRPGGPVAVRTSTGDPQADIVAMFADGYGVLGYYYFTGPAPSLRQALAAASGVGATAVVADQRYTADDADAVQLASPAAAMGAAETSAAPWRAGRPYDSVAVFFAPARRIGFGYLLRTLNPREAQAVGTSQGLFVRAVRRESPAEQVDIAAGDIIIAINGEPAAEATANTWSINVGTLNRILLVRDGRSLQRDVLLPATW